MIIKFFKLSPTKYAVVKSIIIIPKQSVFSNLKEFCLHSSPQSLFSNITKETRSKTIPNSPKSITVTIVLVLEDVSETAMAKNTTELRISINNAATFNSLKSLLFAFRSLYENKEEIVYMNTL